MELTIRSADDKDLYFVTTSKWVEDDGYIDHCVVLTPDELGPYLLNELPYKPSKHSIKKSNKVKTSLVLAKL